MLLSTEDGFIRSVGLGCMHARPLSMCFDRQALYFDSRGPSDLEVILATHDFATDEPLMTKARRCLDLVRELDVSKYNHAGHRDVHAIYGEKTRPRVLVVGQVEDDASIRFGSERRYTNNDLVWLARLENPDAEIIYKPHPDVLVAKRAALSDPRHVEGIARVVREPLAIGDALKTIDRVYTITSLVGFEALMRGIPVTTLGAPFYSGWGLTDDRQPVTRRGRRLTLEQVFAAAYLLYPRYVHPFTGRRIDAEQAIRMLARMKRAAHAGMAPEVATSTAPPSDSAALVFPAPVGAAAGTTHAPGTPARRAASTMYSRPASMSSSEPKAFM